MSKHSECLNTLFYELIRVAIGAQASLSRTPSEVEWRGLFDMAVRQSLVGICFVGLRGLGADSEDGFDKIGVSEDLFFNWMGVAAQIQQRNRVLDDRCVALQKRLSADGLYSCILKGQGVGRFYAEHLIGLRQSGDIDVWVDADEEKTLRWVRKYQASLDFDYKHVHLDVFDGTSVEVHYRPSTSRVPWYIRRVEHFTREKACWTNAVELGDGKINVPSLEFNLVFILQHIFGHLFAEEMTLKQYLDYYFVLRQANEEGADVEAVYDEMKQFGMGRFAEATMWLLHEVFGMPTEWMICKPDADEGRFLLERVMAKEQKAKSGKHGSVRWHLSVFWAQQSKNLHLLTHYPLEVLFSPIWLVRHFFWKRMWKMKHKELFV